MFLQEDIAIDSIYQTMT